MQLLHVGEQSFEPKTILLLAKFLELENQKGRVHFSIILDSGTSKTK